MFTGVVEGCGIVKDAMRVKKGMRLAIDVPRGFPAVKIGGSVSVDGTCLTAIKISNRRICFDVVDETLKRTGMGRLSPGSRVNLELPVRWQGRVEGHFVQGHVDGAGTVKKVVRSGSGKVLEVSFPSTIKRYVIEKGSIAVNGVSLTIGQIRKSIFQIHLIPQTLKLTNLNDLETGDRVNLEADILLKFSRRR